MDSLNGLFSNMFAEVGKTIVIISAVEIGLIFCGALYFTGKTLVEYAFADKEKKEQMKLGKQLAATWIIAVVASIVLPLLTTAVSQFIASLF